MPLSASDVQYLNRLLDKHLKGQRAWPWVRYLSLLAGVVLLVMGGVMHLQANEADEALRSFDDITAQAKPRVEPPATQTVTEVQILELMASDEKMLMGYAKFAAVMTSLRIGLSIMALVLCYFGAMLIIRTIIRWNRHRRDIILITLLREKCEAELMLPDVGAKK